MGAYHIWSVWCCGGVILVLGELGLPFSSMHQLPRNDANLPLCDKADTCRFKYDTWLEEVERATGCTLVTRALAQANLP